MGKRLQLFKVMSKSNLISKETQRAGKKRAHQDSFIARNYLLWIMIAWVFYPLAAAFSALTEGGHVLIRMKTSMGDGFAPYAITGILIIIIEGLKYILGKGAIDDIQAGVFSESGAHKAAFVVKVLGFFGVMAFSITLSVQGAPELNAYMRANNKAVKAPEINLDSINAAYDTRRLPYEANIEAYKKTTWKGKITRQALSSIETEKAELARLEDRRDEELAIARAENERINLEYAEHTEENGQWAMGFAGLGEVVCLFCLIFIGIYDDGLAAEAENSAPPPHQQQAPGFYSNVNNGSYQVPSNYHHPTPRTRHRNPIGFRIHRDGSQSDPPNIPVATGSYRFSTDQTDDQQVDYQVEAKTLIAAFKKARSEYQAWASKLDQGKGKAETNRRHMSELQARMDELERKLADIGIDIKEKITTRA